MMHGGHSAFGLLILCIFRYTDTHGMKIIPMTSVLFEVCCLSARAIVEMDERLPLSRMRNCVFDPHILPKERGDSTSQSENPSPLSTIQPPFIIVPAL